MVGDIKSSFQSNLTDFLLVLFNVHCSSLKSRCDRLFCWLWHYLLCLVGIIIAISYFVKRFDSFLFNKFRHYLFGIETFSVFCFSFILTLVMIFLCIYFSTGIFAFNKGVVVNPAGKNILIYSLELFHI